MLQAFPCCLAAVVCLSAEHGQVLFWFLNQAELSCLVFGQENQRKQDA